MKWPISAYSPYICLERERKLRIVVALPPAENRSMDLPNTEQDIKRKQAYIDKSRNYYFMVESNFTTFLTNGSAQFPTYLVSLKI
jgi:hypothetical protein